jgi:hypothetical protein
MNTSTSSTPLVPRAHAMQQYKNDVKAFIRAGALDDKDSTLPAAIKALARLRMMSIDQAERVWKACGTPDDAPSFRSQLIANIRACIAAARKDGTTAMSVDCLKQNTATPSRMLPGAPVGANAPWAYTQLFREVVDAMSDIRAFARLASLAILLAMASVASAQTATRDAQGNFIEVSASSPVAHDSTTTFTYTYQHGPDTYTLPVFRGPKGGLYVWRLDGKTGVQRKVYLPKQ